MSDQVATQRPVEVDNSWAWLLAATPVLFVLVDATLLFAGYSATWISLAVVVGVTICLLLADQAALKRSGVDLGILWGIFLLPVYLILRARETSQTFAPAAAWVGAFIVSLAGSAWLLSSFALLDVTTVESEIKQSADDLYGSSQQVDCPDREVYRVGARFFCDITDAEGVAQFAVTVQDADGYVSWMPVG